MKEIIKILFLFFFYFLQPKSILPKDVSLYSFKSSTVQNNNLLKNSFFFFFLNEVKQNYITQGCSLYSFKSSRGVGVEIVERDKIL
jgi:hypothetical protein